MSNYKIYPNVKIGENAEIGEFCIIGVPPRGAAEGEYETIIGDNAVIRSHTVIYAGNKIGHGFQTGHGVSIREHNNIGSDVSIGTHSIIEHHIEISDSVRIHSNVFIPEFTRLGKGCWIGPNAVFTNALHPLCPKVKECIKGATVKENAIIGANVTVLPDLIIGKGSFIGAGSLLTKDTRDGCVYAGSPAKQIMETKDITCRYGLIDNPYFPGGNNE